MLMKIRIADRVLVALAGVLLLALCACVIAQSFFDVPVLQTVEGMLSGKKAIAWLPYVLCAVLLALSGYCIALLFRRRRGKRGFVLQDTDGGELSIALSAMDGLVCQCVAVHEEMQLLSSSIKTDRDGVVVDYIDRERMKADVQAARAAGAEMVAMCIHWGDEYKLLPNNSQRLLADFVEALGVDMLIGGHPHVIQPMEFRPNRYYPDKQFVLVYSLGNFISNMKTPDTRGGAMVHVGLGRGSDGRAKLTRAEYRLLFTVPGTRPSDNFRVLEADSVPAGPWRGRAEDFMRRARAVFDKHNVGVAEVRP